MMEIFRQGLGQSQGMCQDCFPQLMQQINSSKPDEKGHTSEDDIFKHTVHEWKFMYFEVCS